MKHLIIVNPVAGNCKETEFLAKINEAFKGLEFEIHETTAPRDATNFLRAYFKDHKELTRVYACGGDGTVNEVVNGLAGVENAELAINPVGTGNDFVKIYGASNAEVSMFREFKPLIEGTPIEVDLAKIESPELKETVYSINVVNFGFDAMVGSFGNQNKLKGKKDPYGFVNAILPAIFKSRYNKIEVTADGEKLNEKQLLLASVANGQWIGGEYHCAPRSSNTDGLLDVGMLKCMPLIPMLANYFTPYKEGKLFDNPKLQKKVVYRQAKKVVVDAPKTIEICVDGEMYPGKHFEVEVMPKAMKLVPPAKVA